MKTISEIYNDYKIMPNLQLHMLRVTAVAKQICDSFDMEIDSESVITACLFHDIGNIIKFDLSRFPEFNQPEGIEYWQSVKDEYIAKYGEDEHQAHLQIIQDFGLSNKVYDLVNGVDTMNFPKQYENGSFESKIVNYADHRVGPFGVLFYEDRFVEAEERYINHKNYIPNEQAREPIRIGKEVEKQIFAKCKINPEDITDESIAPIIEELKNFVILE